MLALVVTLAVMLLFGPIARSQMELGQEAARAAAVSTRLGGQSPTGRHCERLHKSTPSWELAQCLLELQAGLQSLRERWPAKVGPRCAAPDLKSQA